MAWAKSVLVAKILFLGVPRLAAEYHWASPNWLELGKLLETVVPIVVPIGCCHVRLPQ